MLLTALSNKRVIKAASHSDAENCLFGTIAADTAAVFGGTDMIRVHEVKESKLRRIWLMPFQRVMQWIK